MEQAAWQVPVTSSTTRRSGFAGASPVVLDARHFQLLVRLTPSVPALTA
jgi:hypothetical protein